MATKVLNLRDPVPPAKLTVNPDDSIRVNIEFEYRGPAWRETLYSALYVRQWWGIDEVSGGAGAKGWDIPAAAKWVIVRGLYVIVPVPNRPGETFGIYAKLGEIAYSKYWDEVIEIVEVAPPGYALTVRVEPLGAGWVTKEPDKAKYSHGEIVKLTAHPLTGWRFSHWDCDGEYVSSRASENFMMLADRTVTAHFVEI